MQDWPERERYTAEDLLQIIRILRDRENGCPWDKVQTHASIKKNFLECKQDGELPDSRWYL